jgi:hypothetical protein
MPGCGAAYSTQTDNDHFVKWHGSCRGFFVVLSRPAAAEAICGVLATLGDFIHSDPLPPLDTSDE